MLAETNAYDVLLALIVAVPGMAAAVFAGIVALRTKMPNGTKIGAAVAETQAHAADTNELLRRAEAEALPEP